MKAAVLSIALAACGANQAAAPPPVSNRVIVVPPDAVARAAPTGGAAALDKLQQLADAMCRCPDRDCAERLVDEMARWADEVASSGEGGPKVTGAQDEQARVATERMSRCMAEVYRRPAAHGAPAAPAAPPATP